MTVRSFEAQQTLEAERPKAEYLFGPKANGVAASDLKKKDPAEYSRLRGVAVDLGYQGETRRQQLKREVSELRGERRVYTPEEHANRALWPREKVTPFYDGTGVGKEFDLSEIKKTDPQKYYQIRLAAYQYGLVTTKPEKPIAPPVKPEANLFEISEELCKRYSLPIGTKMDYDEFVDVALAFAKVEGQKQRDAEAIAPGTVPAVEAKEVTTK